MNEVYNFLDSLNINNKDTLIVGVSFGPDSMFLLNLLKKKYNDNKIICAHVHHNHRKESDIEAKKLEEYCKNNNIIFEFMKIEEYKDNKFTEEEARHKRYDFFKSLIEKYNSKYLFTAHHGDDLSETILMRITRGSNLTGYKGISLVSKRDNYSVIRPLLFLTKEDIEKYCDEKNIPYAVDLSNESDRYTRNRYRNNILSFFKKENKNVHKKFLQFSKELEEYDHYIRKVVSDKYNSIVNDNIIDICLLNKEEDLIKRKIIELYLFNNYNDNIKLINNNIVDNIISMLISSKPNMITSLPNKKKLVKSYNKIYFDNEGSYNSFCYPLTDLVKLPNGYIIKKVEKMDDTTNYESVFLKSELKLPLYVRNRKNGDKIELIGGTKKVKDIFINEKIEKNKRDNYPVVVDESGNVIWLPGLKKSKYDRRKKGKYDIILKYYKEENNDATK